MIKEPAKIDQKVRRRLTRAMNVLLALAGLAALASLVLEYGGFDQVRVRYRLALHVTQACVLAVFILDLVGRLLLADSRIKHLRENWLDFALILVLAATAAIVFRLRGKFLSVTAPRVDC